MVACFLLLQFFLELFYYSKQVHSEVESQPVQALQQVRKTDPEYCREEGSIFEAVVTAFSSLIDELQQRMVGEIIEQAKLHCHKYRAERFVFSLYAAFEQASKSFLVRADRLICASTP